MSFIAALLMFLQSMFGSSNVDAMKDVHITTNQYYQVATQNPDGATGVHNYTIDRSSGNLIVIVDQNEF